MAKYLGIDYGLERTGIAVTDPEGRLAFPLRTLRLSSYPSRSRLLDDLAALVSEENIQEIVVGLPLYPDGGENLMCRQVRNMAARLRRRVDKPIHFMSEVLSSQEALEDLRKSAMKKRNYKQALDQQAACRILQSFLDQQDRSP